MTVQLKNLISYATEEPDTYERNKPYYILKANGVYRHTLRDSVLVKELYSGLDRDLPLLPKGAEAFEYVLPKIPFNIYLLILDFYKAVYDLSNTEASCHVFYLGEDELVIPNEFDKYRVGVLQIGEWLVYCPQQTNHGTLTSFREDKLYPYLRKHYRLAIETHSHHKMDAFWSGTDNANQKDPVLYGVFGKIGTQDNFLVKYVHEASNITIPSEVIIDYPLLVQQLEGAYSDLIPTAPTKMVYKGAFKSLNEFPKEWLRECHKVAKSRGLGDAFAMDVATEELDRPNSARERQEVIAYTTNSEAPKNSEQEGNRVGRFFHNSPLKKVADAVKGNGSGKTEDKQLPKPRGTFYE